MSKSREQVVNFAAGPAALPTNVLEQAAKDLINYQGCGMSLAELSHRGKPAQKILKDAVANLNTLLEIPDNYDVLFMQGGGTTQFSALVYNVLAHRLLKKGSVEGVKLDYVVTGAWSSKAAAEAKRLYPQGTNVVANAKALNGKFGSIPPQDTWKTSDPANTAFLYYCDNETIDGVEFPAPPTVPEGVELIADTSSNILSRKIDVSKHAIIYAGAQKNIGMPGVTIVIIRKDLLERADAAQCSAAGVPVTPIMLDYKTIADNESLYNTLPVFPVHIANLVFEHLLARGGLQAQEDRNTAKSSLLYNTLAAYPSLYTIVADADCRSRTNVPFRIQGEGFEDEFLKGAEEMDMYQLKGHRSVGGIRASLYNAVELEGVEKLVNYLKEFAQAKGVAPQ
ncbi:phosphoserine aminotransferase [Saitoella complicata NRRL Y-17804]|uniref:phosphoserine transaminase n=1 Tax=Saitoella complicata (strain BCRC 22490 / CBS 7301 / JCM 7358 / NBRC 10748 / NRRL Y-17804) TaxID=698492 RepID=A0A0E9NPI8_SAICN|nr:phosphoserine aminotransferase [Saitoella complicata NRRL Y-17804]ODQ51882.1 phosphoserine aminotransferase [Saitoella complicata NRRL Y-17804]GAO51749.1 hypothetical protein G7K_5842-t1 [Saitoella complicata NRRL Y-17804]